MLVGDGPYAVMALKEVRDIPPTCHELQLPLTLAYSLSEHIRFLLLMTSLESKVIDAAFDQVLRRGVPKSRGIEYVKDCTNFEFRELVNQSTFLLTTDAKVKDDLFRQRAPYIYLSFQTEYAPSVKLGFLEELSDEPLRRHLLNSVRLVSAIHDRISRRVLRNSAPA